MSLNQAEAIRAWLISICTANMKLCIHNSCACSSMQACDPIGYVRGRSVDNWKLNNNRAIALDILQMYLSLNTCIYTNMVYVEAGEIPIGLCVMCKTIKYWSGLTTWQTMKFFIYKFIYSLHTNNIYHSLWILLVKKIVCDCGFSEVW